MTTAARCLSPTELLVLSPAQAAELLGISRSKVYELTGAGLLRTITVFAGGPIRIRRSDLDAYLDERSRASAEAMTTHLTLTVPFSERGQHGQPR